MVVAAARATSATTAASKRFVAEHLARATAIGERLADIVADPDAFVSALRSGFAEIGDPTVQAGQRLIAPGIGPVLGVRLPLMTAVHRAFKRGSRQTSSSQILDVTDRLLREEIREIRPAIEWAQSQGLPVEGPFPPDTLFYLAVRRKLFDAVVCMYHDQGHIPLKLLDFEGGVNVSLGLPIVRTSVDHGTAFDIAGQGLASTASFLRALDLAARLAGAST